ncbi:MAG TPA: ferrous iron transport protein B [Phnomibacter sp.]|nr:ferrous iron transport protein B [Phnomibacter sp.]
MQQQNLQIALVGNPNCGKTSLFNALTGLNQKVGNFPGVTVDKKTGHCPLGGGLKATVVDLPGTYSLYPKRHDEWVTYRILLQQDTDINPEVVVLVADASNLKRNLLFASQILDLKVPVVIALTMMDLARQKGIRIDVEGLEVELGVPVVPVNPRKNKGIPELKRAIEQVAGLSRRQHPADFIDNYALAPVPIDAIRQAIPGLSHYTAIHHLIHHEEFNYTPAQQQQIETLEKASGFNPTKTQAEEILQRYHRIRQVMQKTVVEPDPLAKKMFSDRLDDILLHHRWGYLILLAVLFLLFQSIFWLAQYPMDGIEWAFGELSAWLSASLPEAWWSNLLINGVVAGLSGILVFVPQIMILFGLITLLEDSGYMARISFLTDRLMRKVGLNGKSVMPMISGYACAVPAIMSARSIENRKERLLTILVTPLMSCSARLPVFTILIALIIPNTYFLGFLSLQGLVLMGLYLFGTVMALAVAWVGKWFINLQDKSFFILELPVYRAPRWKNMVHTMVEKARIFVVDAGKVIMLISLILWALSSYGPLGRMEALNSRYELLRQQPNTNSQALETAYQAEHLANSYAGLLGKAIEPVITPLGYDWKIGIALITSFAAREVFVGTMATLYSVGQEEADENSLTLRQKMQTAQRADGSPVYTLATGMSLMIFYLLAMQCMSTLAIVHRETKSWKWPAIQLLYMTALAYGMSWIAYLLFS